MTRFQLQPPFRAGEAEPFVRDLKAALGALPPGTLPLASGCTQGGAVDDRDPAFSVLRVEELEELIVARIGVFFTEVVGGCNCSEEPVAHNAYCVLELRIDRKTGISEGVPSDE